MWPLFRYTEEFDAAAWFPFKSGWAEMHTLFLVVQTLLTIGTGLLFSSVFLAQPFLAIFIGLVSFYIFLYIRGLEKRMNQITEASE